MLGGDTRSGVRSNIPDQVHEMRRPGGDPRMPRRVKYYDHNDVNTEPPSAVRAFAVLQFFFGAILFFRKGLVLDKQHDLRSVGDDAQGAKLVAILRNTPFFV